MMMFNDPDVKQFAINAFGAIHEAAAGIRGVAEQTFYDMQAPHVKMRPRVFLDSPGVWCAMYGACLADSPAGFGSSPRAACEDFDRRWNWTVEQIAAAAVKNVAESK